MTSEEVIDENSNRKEMNEREYENDFLLFQEIVILKSLLKYIKDIFMRSNLT